MAISSSYSMINVSATVDGQQIIGLWDGDDSIAVAEGADEGTMSMGSAGDGIFSVSADRSATITIRLQHTSPTHRLLVQKQARQKALGGAASSFPFSVIDTVSGEGGSADKCYIQTAPGDSKGSNATSREWVLVTTEYQKAVPNG